MTLVRWNPVTGRELTTIQDEVNRLFDGFFGRSPLRYDLAPAFTPAVDVQETPEAFVVHVDLPGVSPKDVKVSLTGDTLTIRGERKHDRESKNGGQRRFERSYGSFERSFTLGTPVRSDKVQATYRDGVLEINVPKAEEAKVREIEVQVGA